MESNDFREFDPENAECSKCFVGMYLEDGLEWQDTKYVFCKDCEQEIIEKLLKVAVRNPEFGILSPMQLNCDGTEIDQRVRGSIYRGAPKFYSDAFLNKLSDCYELPFISGASWLVSVSCIKHVGGFDSLFFMYGEDDDYCFRAKAHGYKIGLVPDSTIFHKRITKPRKGKRANIDFSASRKTSTIMVTLKTTHRNFLIEVILQGYYHLKQIIQAIAKWDIGELVELVISGLKIFTNLSKIWRHRNYSLQNSAFMALI